MSAAVLDETEIDGATVAPVGFSAATATAARRLEPRIAEVCGQLNVLFAELARLVGEVEATGAWHGQGIRSLNHWVQWQTGLAGSNVRELIALAAARATHPKIIERFDDGRLSLDQAARAVECQPGDDTEFAHLATVLTLPQLHNALRAANPPEPKPTETNESVTMGPNRHGQWECTLRLDGDRGAVIEAALAAMRDELFRDGTGDVTWADAAVELANRGLDSAATARRERFRINLFIDFNTDGKPTTTWSDGAKVPDSIRDLLACDATITPITRIGGHPVNVGRAQRIVPDRTRRIVEHRDHKCRVPWCPHKRWLQIHHIIHWTGDDGPTETSNLIALCPACHRQHHLGELGITGNADLPDGLTFTDHNHNTINPATRPTKPTGPPPQPRHPYQHPNGGRIHHDALLFSPLRRTRPNWAK
jgi:Domain of unknown function (DUF222)/HNH endonuclease